MVAMATMSCSQLRILTCESLDFFITWFKLNSYSNAKHFSLLSRMHISVFEVMSVYLID